MVKKKVYVKKPLHLTKHQEKLISLKAKIKEHSNKFKLPSLENEEVIETHSWFDITSFPQESELFDNPEIKYDTLIGNVKGGFKNKFNDVECFTKKVKIDFTNRQRKIILKWMNA